FIPYLDSRCDFCIGIQENIPECVKTCPYKAIELKEVEEKPEENIYFVGDNLAVKSRRWFKEERSL
ncbi:MAG: hypothetical protein NC898_06620, partial [Candidatus Omnitrophica bacterium]|nr:hypothetical protein [Candidatus Omnitrophota bacterium]